MYLPFVLLLLGLVAELQVADADCEIEYCVDNKECDIEFIDCRSTSHSQEALRIKETYVKEVNCSDVIEFKNSTCQYYKIDKDVNFITITEIDIPDGVKVTIGQLDCKGGVDDCKILKLGPKAVPPIPHLYFKRDNKRFKISATAPTATIKFTCERQCHNVGENKNRMMKRIVDGVGAIANEYPFMARLCAFYTEDKDNTDCNTDDSANKTEVEKKCGNIREYLCGGSILQKDYVLTAQHCVVDSTRDVEKLLDAIDQIPKDGLVDFDEFFFFLQQFYPGMNQFIAEYWFNRFNFNKVTPVQNQTLDKEELAAFFHAMNNGDYFPGFDQSVNQLFNDGDNNPNDGFLSFDEFFNLLQNLDPSIEEYMARHWFEIFKGDDEFLDIDEFNEFYNMFHDTLFSSIFTQMSLIAVPLYLVGVIVTVGDHSKAADEMEQDDIWVRSGDVIRSGGYNPVTLDYDVALLKLSVAIDLKPGFRYPICMPPYYWDDTAKMAGTDITVAGWGKTENPLIGLPDTLREGNMDIILDAICKLPLPITARMICMLQDISKFCNGDSGGPGFCKADDNYYYEIGVVSFGYKDENKKWIDNFPQVYAKVTQFLKWIAIQVKYLP